MTTSGIMRMTLLALLPGTVAYTWLYGAGVIINLIVAITVAAATEAIILRMRQLPILSLGDGTVMVSAVLLGLCLPPLLPLAKLSCPKQLLGILLASLPTVAGRSLRSELGIQMLSLDCTDCLWSCWSGSRGCGRIFGDSFLGPICLILRTTIPILFCQL